MKAILRQFKKATDACNTADIQCQKLAKLLLPYFHEDLREEISVFDQSGDGLVVLWNERNYPVSSVIDAIQKGATDIDMRDYYNCVITPI